MKNIKLHFVFDTNGKLSHQRLKFLKKFKNYSPQKADLITVLGGDGFMLQTLKKLGKFNKPFYGMNIGTYGFLMNKFKTKKFTQNIAKSKPVTISALQMIAKTKNNIVKKAIAINEISMFRQSKQTASLQIKNGKRLSEFGQKAWNTIVLSENLGLTLGEPQVLTGRIVILDAINVMNALITCRPSDSIIRANLLQSSCIL